MPIRSPDHPVAGRLLIVGACTASPAAPSPSQAVSPAPSASEAAGPTPLPGCASLEAPADEGRAHLAEGETASYGSYPPTSGPHDPIPAETGWYDEMQPVEALVHSLEHGYIVLYRSGLGPADEAALRARFDELVAEGFGGLISVPDESIKDPMTLTAWNRLQRCVRAEPDALEGFVREHYAQAPEATAACALEGAAALAVCEAVLASPSPSATRAPTAADAALLARVPEPLQAACSPTTSLPDGGEAGWSCFSADGNLAYVYMAFATDTSRDAYFDQIVAALGNVPEGDCATDGNGIGPYTRGDGTTGRLACSDADGTKALYWTTDGSADLGAVLAIEEADLRAFFETAGPMAQP
jgi:hypothetical protein